MRRTSRFYIISILLLVAMTIIARPDIQPISRAEKQFQNGLQISRTMDVASQNKAIELFRSAKIAFTENKQRKTDCDTQIKKCEENIRKIKRRNNDKSKSITTASTKPDTGMSIDTIYLGTKAYAQVDDIEIWPNQNIRGELGMLIQMRLEIQGMKDKKCRVMAFFNDEDGHSLKDTNGKYASAGLVVSDEIVTPDYSGALWKEFKLGMPYSELHLSSSGDKSVQICIAVFDISGPQAEQLLVTPGLLTSFYYDDTQLEVNGNRVDEEVEFTAAGGEKKFNVVSNSSWTLQEVPSWCKIERKTDKGFVLVCPPNKVTRPHHDYFDVRAGRKRVRIYITQPAATSASATIHKVWVDDNVFQDILLGSYIHSDLEVFGLFNQDIVYSVLFYTADGKAPLIDEDGQQIQYSSTMAVEYDICRWSDWFVFIPNAWLKNATNSDGRYTFDVVVKDANGTELVRCRNTPLNLQ